MILIATSLAMAALSLHFFWTYEVKQDKDGKHCRGISTYSTFLRYYWPWLTLAFYSFIPFTILLCTSAGIMLKVLHSNYKKRHNFNQESQVKLTSLTRALLTVSFVFIVTTGPVVVYRLVSIIDRNQSLGQGNVFPPVCVSFCSPSLAGGAILSTGVTYLARGTILSRLCCL